MKKFVSSLLVVSIFFVVVSPAMASSIPADNNAEINDLLDRRAEYVCLEQWDEVAFVEQQLANLGVEKLTPAEVEEQFVNNTASDEIQTRVTTPIYANTSAYVMSVEITGIESKTVSDISPVCPQFPAHIT